MTLSSFQKDILLVLFFIAFVLCISLLFAYLLVGSLFGVFGDPSARDQDLSAYKLPENVPLNLPLEDAPAFDSILENQIVLVDGKQGGQYQYFVKFAPKNPGFLLVKAYEITSGDSLSMWRINETPTVISQNPELDVYSGEFTIYENDWDEFFGARIELWFDPENGSPIRVAEDNFQVEGWMR